MVIQHRPPALGLLAVLVLVEVDDRHIRSFHGVGHRYCPPDTGVTAGDTCSFALELPRRLIVR